MEKAKMILISSLIVMAIVVVIVVVTQQLAKAELTFKEKLYVDNSVRLAKSHLQICTDVLAGDPAYSENAMKSILNETKAEVLTGCDKDILITTAWCKYVSEQADIYRKSGICESPLLTKYIDGGNLWSKID